MSRSMVFFLLVVAPAIALVLAWLGAASLPENRMGWFLLIMSLAYLVGIPLYIWKQKGRPPARSEEAGDRSFWLVLPGFVIAIFGAPLEFLYLPALLPRSEGFEIAGLLLVGAGAALQSWVRQAIRGQFSGHVQIQADHRLVIDGPYRFVRHPGYLGYLLVTLGIALGYGSLVSLASVFILLLPGLLYRMGVEEKLLVEEFGTGYREYARRTRRLIPWIW